MREEVRSLHAAGMRPREIATALGVAKGTVTYHLHRLDLPVDPRFGRRYDWEEISRAYGGGLSMRQCLDRFGCSRDAWYDAVRRGDIELRPQVVPIDDFLAARIKRGRENLKRRLFEAGLKENRCEKCGITEWQGKPLNMALHHINGDGTDNRLENLAILCPNCHAQTPNYGGRNGHRRRRLDEAA